MSYYLQIFFILLSWTLLSQEDAEIKDSFSRCENDMTFVLMHGDNEFRESVFNVNDIGIDSNLIALCELDVGQVLGPIKMGGSNIWYKIIKKEYENRWNVGNIILSNQRYDEEKSKQVAEYILKRSQRKGGFNECCRKHSDDANNQYDCEIKEFSSGDMIQKFDASLKGKSVNDVWIVRTQFGTHIVKMLKPRRSVLRSMRYVKLERRNYNNDDFSVDFPYRPKIDKKVIKNQLFGEFQSELLVRHSTEGAYALTILESEVDLFKSDSISLICQKKLIDGYAQALSMKIRKMNRIEDGPVFAHSFDLIEENGSLIVKGKTVCKDNKCYLINIMSRDEESLRVMEKFIRSFKLK